MLTRPDPDDVQVAAKDDKQVISAGSGYWMIEAIEAVCTLDLVPRYRGHHSRPYISMLMIEIRETSISDPSRSPKMLAAMMEVQEGSLTFGKSDDGRSG